MGKRLAMDIGHGVPNMPTGFILARMEAHCGQSEAALPLVAVEGAESETVGGCCNLFFVLVHLVYHLVDLFVVYWIVCRIVSRSGTIV